MALLVKRSQLPNSGKGLFTSKPIKKGSRVIEYRGEIIVWQEYRARVDRNEDGYLFFINKKRCIDAWPTPQYKARYANDARGLSRAKKFDNNCDYEVIDNKCYIVAQRDIKPGEEIFVDYTKDYWDVIKYNIKLKKSQG